MTTTPDRAAARYHRIIERIDSLINDGQTARRAGDHDTADSLMERACELEDEAHALADRFDIP